jgi:hypothetical protein
LTEPFRPQSAGQKDGGQQREREGKQFQHSHAHAAPKKLGTEAITLTDSPQALELSANQSKHSACVKASP